MQLLMLALLVGVLLTQDLIDLEVAFDVAGWHANAPVADTLALALLGVAAGHYYRKPIPPPGWAGYLLFLMASAVSVSAAVDPHLALHHLLRKPIFLYVTYGMSLAWVVANVVSERQLQRTVLAWAFGTAGLSLAASLVRIGGGDALWFQPIVGITPNHKTLTVAMAAWVPLMLVWRDKAGARAAIALIGLAVLASASKTAWITFAFGFAWCLPTARPLASRPRLMVPLLAGALALAVYAPFLLRSKAMLDAARSRHSIDLRAWEMFTDHPIFGSGTGMNVVHEMVTFPHYRVNGVDAHGVFQKIASETGLFGLLGFAWFTVATGLVLRKRWWSQRAPLDGAVLGTWCALHVNLLLSTETFSPTHWVPVGICWGLAHRAWGASAHEDAA